MTERYDDRMEIYDDRSFRVFKTAIGRYASEDRKGESLCSGLDRDAVIFWSREHLNGFQNSTATVTNTKIGDAVKL